MKKPAIVIFITYVWTKTLLGLTFSPYHSMRDVARNKVLTPVVFSPILGILLLLIIGRIGATFFTLHGIFRETFAIMLSAGLISILLWQILLIYLLSSLYFAMHGK
jgi:hypothetical protein